MIEQNTVKTTNAKTRQFQQLCYSHLACFFDI